MHKFDVVSQEYFEGIVPRGKQISCLCPFHDNKKTPAGSFNLETGQYYCFSCGARAHDIVQLIQKLENINRKEAIELIKVKFGGLGLNLTEEEFNTQFYEALREKKQKDFGNDLLNLNILHRFSFEPHKYWFSRGFTKETIDKFKLGFDPITEFAVITYFGREGGIIGFDGRAPDNENKIRYKLLWPFNKSSELDLLNFCDGIDSVIMTEGGINARFLWQNGFPTVATFGAKVSQVQIELIKKNFKEITIWRDDDDAGEKYEKFIIKSLEKTGVKVNILKQIKKDANMMTKDEIKQHLDNKVIVKEDDEFQRLLSLLD